MNEESIWMAPESFVERFWQSPALLGWFIEFRSKKTYQRDMDLARQLVQGILVPLEMLLTYEMLWHEDIDRVADRKIYAKYVGSGKVFTRAFPIVDKVSDTVIELSYKGSHFSFVEMLYLAHNIMCDDSTKEEDKPAAYLLQGHGYFCSSCFPKFLVGQQLLNKELLDEADEIILNGRFVFIGSKIDYLNIKAYYF